MHKPRLLIVDDDPDLTFLMMAAGEAMGYAVASCDTPADLAAAYRPDLTAIIVDMVMPQMDGVEVIRWLAGQKSKAGIILVSSVDKKVITAAESLVRGRNLQLIGSLQKPFVPENLSVLLSKARLATKTSSLHRHPLAELARKMPPKDEIVILFQPKIDLHTLDFCSVEALVRWQHPGKGLIGPGFFVPAAEKSGNIDALTDMIIMKTLEQCNLWMKTGLILDVSINISARTLGDTAFPDRLEHMLTCYGVSPAQIVIEVTETWLSTEPIECLDSLTRLHLKGFRISIDDFGTGYSSLSQLSHIPFSELKIDQSFIKHAPQNHQARKILDSSVELGHHLNLKVVAEGVETREQWDLVMEANCDECQGFFIARPLPGDSTPAWLERWQQMQGIKPGTAARHAQNTGTI